MNYTDEMIIQLRHMKPSMLSKRQRAALVNYYLEADAETLAYIKSADTQLVKVLGYLSTMMILGKVPLDLDKLELYMKDVEREMGKEKGHGIYWLVLAGIVAVICACVMVLFVGWQTS